MIIKHFSESRDNRSAVSKAWIFRCQGGCGESCVVYAKEGHMVLREAEREVRLHWWSQTDDCGWLCLKCRETRLREKRSE